VEPRNRMEGGAVNGMRVAINGMRVAINGMRVAVNGMREAVNGMREAVNGQPHEMSIHEMSIPQNVNPIKCQLGESATKCQRGEKTNKMSMFYYYYWQCV